MALDGLALLQDYEQERAGAIAFRGHAIFLPDRDGAGVSHWMFDSMGFAPAPAYGDWQGEALVLEKSTPRGEARQRHELAGDRYHLLIEHRLPGEADFTEFLRGEYTRLD